MDELKSLVKEFYSILIGDYTANTLTLETAYGNISEKQKAGDEAINPWQVMRHTLSDILKRRIDSEVDTETEKQEKQNKLTREFTNKMTEVSWNKFILGLIEEFMKLFRKKRLEKMDVDIELIQNDGTHSIRSTHTLKNIKTKTNAIDITYETLKNDAVISLVPTIESTQLKNYKLYTISPGMAQQEVGYANAIDDETVENIHNKKITFILEGTSVPASQNTEEPETPPPPPPPPTINIPEKNFEKILRRYFYGSFFDNNQNAMIYEDFIDISKSHTIKDTWYPNLIVNDFSWQVGEMQQPFHGLFLPVTDLQTIVTSLPSELEQKITSGENRNIYIKGIESDDKNEVARLLSKNTYKHDPIKQVSFNEEQGKRYYHVKIRNDCFPPIFITDIKETDSLFDNIKPILDKHYSKTVVELTSYNWFPPGWITTPKNVYYLNRDKILFDTTYEQQGKTGDFVKQMIEPLVKLTHSINGATTEYDTIHEYAGVPMRDQMMYFTSASAHPDYTIKKAEDGTLEYVFNISPIKVVPNADMTPYSKGTVDATQTFIHVVQVANNAAKSVWNWFTGKSAEPSASPSEEKKKT
jgi:hypothetical protein